MLSLISMWLMHSAAVMHQRIIKRKKNEYLKNPSIQYEFELCLKKKLNIFIIYERKFL